MLEITKYIKIYEKFSDRQKELKDKLYNSVSSLEKEEQDNLIAEIDSLDAKMQEIESKTFVCEISTLRENVIKIMHRKGYFANMPYKDYDEVSYYKDAMANHEIRRMYILDDEFCKKQMEKFGDYGEIELRIDLILNSSIMYESVLLMEKMIMKRKYLKEKYNIDIF